MSQVDISEEETPVVDSKMYPNGINGDFYNLSKLPNEEVVTNFTNKFEDVEGREIAKCVPDILELLKKNGLDMNNKVCDIGGGTGVLLKHLSTNSKDLICTEVSKAFHEHLLQRVKRDELNNVTCILNTDPHSPQLDKHENSIVMYIII